MRWPLFAGQCAACLRHASITVTAGFYKETFCSIETRALRGFMWEDEMFDACFKDRAAAPLIVMRFEEEGNGKNVSHRICWNKYHAEFCKLPEMSAEEASILMPFELPLEALLVDSKEKPGSKKKALAKQKKERRARRKARSR